MTGLSNSLIRTFLLLDNGEFTSVSASASVSSAGFLRGRPRFPLPLAAAASSFAARFTRASSRSSKLNTIPSPYFSIYNLANRRTLTSLF
jgi:hypothetical protein